MRRRRQVQLELPPGRRWGGKRAGAGRKLVASRPSPPHRPRARHHARWPVHVTLRARGGLPSLRSARVFPVLRRSLAAAHKTAFRVVHFSVQSDHVHLLVEGDHPLALVRGLQGLAARCAKAVNRAARRRGSVWCSRYHGHPLRTPTEARRGLVYILLSFRKHLRAAPGVDPRSSGAWFGGWRDSPPTPHDASPVAPPRTWLAAVGWRRAGGAIAVAEGPGPESHITRPRVRGHSSRSLLHPNPNPNPASRNRSRPGMSPSLREHGRGGADRCNDDAFDAPPPG
jgi:putative transposase